MIRVQHLILGLLLIAANVVAQEPAIEETLRMTVSGDQEAPLVLYIVPWQPPKPVTLPTVSREALIPRVVDHEHGLAQDPTGRSTRIETVQ